MKISVVINTFNAEEFFEKVLESVKDFDEIVVCDMYSTDRTIEIAKKYGCRIFFHENTGYAEPARAYAISQAANDWVLVVDADEIVPVALKDYLYDFAANTTAAGLCIPRKNYFMGRFMRAEYPDRILRFMIRDKSQWPHTIHSMPFIDGRVDVIPACRKDLAFIHLGGDSLRSIISKANIYTEMEIVRRRGRKYGWGALIFHPWLRFFKLYILKGGILDGIPGLILAYERACYKFYTIAKVIEARMTEKSR